MCWNGVRVESGYSCVVGGVGQDDFYFRNSKFVGMVEISSTSWDVALFKSSFSVFLSVKWSWQYLHEDEAQDFQTLMKGLKRNCTELSTVLPHLGYEVSHQWDHVRLHNLGCPWYRKISRVPCAGQRILPQPCRWDRGSHCHSLYEEVSPGNEHSGEET